MPTVVFPARLTESAISRVLRQHYSSSLTATEESLFQLQPLEWCDILSLSLLSLWLSELAERGRHVSLSAPASPRAVEFLKAYGLVSLLDRLGVRHDFVMAEPPIAPTERVAPYFPLTFLDQPAFTKLLETLRAPGRLSDILKEASASELVRSGAIRDVVIAELGLNAFDHGSGRFAHMLMTKLGGLPRHTGQSLAAELRDAGTAERAFLANLRGGPYLAIVISDLGSGIPSTLREAYAADSVLTGKSDSQDDATLLEYALLPHSTRRSLEERIGVLARCIEAPEDAPPATGLWELRRVVQAFRGLLVLRSGDARLALDFLSEAEPRPQLLRGEPRIGGTQVKLLFPVTVPRQMAPVRASGSAPRMPPSLHVSVPTAPSAGSSPHGRGPVDEASDLHDALTAIERDRHAGRRGAHLVVDLSQLHYLSAKAIHYLLLELMRRQSPSHECTVVVNAPPLHSAPTTRSHRVTPLLVFDSIFVPTIHGLPPESTAAFRSLLKDETADSPAARQFAADHPEWFEYQSGSPSRYVLRTPPALLHSCAVAAYATLLSAALLASNSPFFLPAAKVLLPSSRYARGYFDVAALASTPWAVGMLRAWVRVQLKNLGAQHCIVVGRTAALLWPDEDGWPPSLPSPTRVATPLSPSHVFTVATAVPPRASAVLLVDALGSAATLRGLLRTLGHASVIGVVAIVDARPDGDVLLGEDGRSLTPMSILRHPLSYYTDLPAGWHYDDIRQVDGDTHALLRPAGADPSSAAQAGEQHLLWYPRQAALPLEPTGDGTRRSAFLEDVVIPAAAHLEGHYGARRWHATYVFNIQGLMGAEGPRIAELIGADVETYLAKMASPQTVERVLFPADSLGLANLAEILALRLPGALPSPIAPGTSALSPAAEGAATPGTVLVLEDALFSGESLYEMLDLAESAGASQILAYVIVRRSSDRQANRLRKLRQYDHAIVRVRECAAVELPLYTPQECPLCRARLRLEEIVARVADGSVLERLAQQEINDTSLHDVTIACREAAQQPSRSIRADAADRLRLRALLERAKHMVGARNALATVVRNAERAPRMALRLFEVLEREAAVFLHDSPLQERIFYATFREDLIRSSRAFIADPGLLTEAELRGVAAVLAALDSVGFLHVLRRSLERTDVDEARAWVLVRECLVNPVLRRWPDQILEALKDARTSCPQRLARLVSDAITLWDSPPLRSGTVARVQEYLRLVGPALHDLTKAIEKLASDARRAPATAQRDAPVISRNLSSALADLRGFVAAIPEGTTRSPLGERVHALDENLRTLRAAIAAFSRDDPSGTEDLVEHVERCCARIVELIGTPMKEGSIRCLMQRFRTNIVTQALAPAADHLSAELSNLGISLSCSFPDSAPIVFGDEFSLYLACRNLIENLCKSSATTARAFVSFNHERHRVIAAVLDNGTGLTEDPQPRYGLRQVTDAVTAFGGTFVLRNVRADDPTEYQEFRTIALMELPYLPEVRR